MRRILSVAAVVLILTPASALAAAMSTPTTAKVGSRAAVIAVGADAASWDE